MRSLLVLVIILGSVPVTLLKPHIGVIMWSWISYMNPHRLTWGIAQTFPVAAIVGGATLVAWLISREPKRFPLTGTTTLLIMLTVWFTVTTLAADVGVDFAWSQWNKIMKILLFTYVTMALMYTRERLTLLIWTIVVSLGFYGFRGGIFTLLTGGNYRVWGPPGSFIADNNQLALALIMTLPLIRYLHLTVEARWMRMGLLAGMLLTFVAIIGTYSRGALLGMSAMALFLWLKSRHRLALGIVLVIGMIGGIAFMPSQWGQRMGTIETYEQDKSARGRLDAWTFDIKLAQDHPIFGGGFGASADRRLWAMYMPGLTPRVSHSIWFQMLGLHGYPGLLLFVLLLASAWRTGTRILRTARDREDLVWARDLAAMTQVGLIGYAVSGSFLNLATFDLYYHYVAILVLTEQLVLKAIVTPAEAEAPAAAEPPVPVVASASPAAPQASPRLAPPSAARGDRPQRPSAV